MGDREKCRSWQLPDELWERVKPLLPAEKPLGSNGRPVVPFRKVMEGIFYVLRTGIQWKAVPQEFGSGSTIHARFQEWRGQGVFKKLWEIGVEEYDELKGIGWKFQCMDGAMTKAPLGGEKKRAESHRPREKRHKTLCAV